MNKLYTVILGTGEMLYFKGKIEYSQYEAVDNLCKFAYMNSNTYGFSVETFCNTFINMVKNELGIKLQRVKIEYVFRTRTLGE